MSAIRKQSLHLKRTATAVTDALSELESFSAQIGALAVEVWAYEHGLLLYSQ